MEQHLVFYKTEYGSFAESLKHSDGVTVLAVFYEVSIIVTFKITPGELILLKGFWITRVLT
jgi:hypothetical protein